MVPGGEACPGVGERGQGPCSRQGSVAAKAERPEDSRASQEQQLAQHHGRAECGGREGLVVGALTPFGLL